MEEVDAYDPDNNPGSKDTLVDPNMWQRSAINRKSGLSSESLKSPFENQGIKTNFFNGPL